MFYHSFSFFLCSAEVEPLIVFQLFEKEALHLPDLEPASV